MNSIDHTKRARGAWRKLVKNARKGQKITYGAIAGSLGLHHRSARWFLGVIQEQCEAQGLPPLQAIVVNKKTGIPGSGYVATGRDEKSYRAALEEVREYDWPKTAPF